MYAAPTEETVLSEPEIFDEKGERPQGRQILAR